MQLAVAALIVQLANPAANLERPSDPSSLRSITEYVERVEAWAKVQKKLGLLGEEEIEELEEKAEHWGMRQRLLHARAWPGDQLDQEAYRKAIRHRDEVMQPVNSPAFAGASWTFIGPRNQQPSGNVSAPVAGRVNAVKYSPADPTNDWWVGAATGGLFKTTDASTNWFAQSDSWPYTYVSAIAIDPTNANRMYVATGDYPGWWGYGFGLLRSTNGGSSWVVELQNELQGREISDVMVNPDSPNVVLVAAGRGSGPASASGLWRSTDYGNTWTQVFSTNDTAGISDLAFSISSSGVRNFYAAGGNNGYLYRSTDGFATYASTLDFDASGGIMALATSTTHRDRVYVACMDGSRVKRSDDGGQTLSNVTTSGLSWGQVGYNYMFGCLNSKSDRTGSDVLVFGMVEFYALLPGASSWSTPFGTSGNRTLHVDHHGFDRHPTQWNRALIANDGGVYTIAYFDTLGLFGLDNHNQALRNTEHVHASAHPALDPEYVMTGMWHNGVGQSLGDPWTWYQRRGGDGMYSIIHSALPTTQMATIQALWSSSSDIGIGATADGWVNATTLNTTYAVANESFNFIAPMDEVANEGGAVYFAGERLYKVRYTASGVTWTKNIGNFDYAPDQGENAMSIDSMDNATKGVYVGTSLGKVYGTLDVANTPTLIKDYGTPVTCVNGSPTDYDEVLIALGNQGAPGGTGALKEITDWTNVLLRREYDRSGTGNNALPAIGVNWVERDPYDPVSTWYAATDVGVFYTEDRGANWYNATNSLGLPNAMALHLVARDGYLYCSTFGRGIWRMTLRTTKPKVTALDIVPTFVTGGNPAQAVVALDAVAPPGGLTVSLTSTVPAAVPNQTVTVPQGQSTYTFNLDTEQTTQHYNVTVTASANGGQATDTLTVNECSILSLSLPSSIISGSDFNFEIYLDRVAPQGGVTIGLAASPSSAVTLPAQVVIPAGSAFRQFSGTARQTPQNLNFSVQASKPGSGVQDSSLITGVQVSAVDVIPGTVTNTDAFQVRVTLSSPAGNNGFPLTGQAGMPSVAFFVTPSFSVAPGQTQVFAVGDTNYVATDTLAGLRVWDPFGQYFERSILVEHLDIVGLTASPNPVVGGNASTGTVAVDRTLTRSQRVYLNSSDTSVLTVPAFTTVAAGQLTANFAVNTQSVLSPKQVTVTAKLLDPDQPAKTLTVYVVPPLVVVPPTAFTVTLGQRQTGDLTSFRSTDGNVMRVCKFVVPNQSVAPVQVTVEANAPVPVSSTLAFSTNSRMASAGSFSQQLELWNWAGNGWDATDTRTDAVNTTMTQRDLAATGNLARYYQNGTFLLRARYQVRKTGPSAVSAWCHEMDRAVWVLGF